MAHADGDARVDLLSVVRGAADTVTVQLRVLNESDEVMMIGASLAGRVSAHYEPDGVTLVDATNNKRYFPLLGTDDACLCTNLDDAAIEPGSAQDIEVIFPAPSADVQTIVVAVPLTPPFVNVPIAAGPAEASIDPATTPTKSPMILPLISTVEGREASIDEDDETQEIRLSADVLFALNKAHLTARARSVMQDVAARIDRSSGDTVTIDGHTDSTGSDAINDPLSRRRAQAVERVLRKTVTRRSVEYRSAGHGSRDPVAANDTAEGRKKNRRVTVTFARPDPPAPEPAPAPEPSAGNAGAGPALQPRPGMLPGLDAEIDSLQRDPSGLVSLAWTATNSGSEELQVSTPFSSVDYYEGGTTTAVSLVDSATNMRYRVLRDAKRRCLCSDFTGVGRSFLDAGQHVTYFNMYKLPLDINTVTVAIPGFAPARDVPIQ